MKVEWWGEERFVELATGPNKYGSIGWGKVECDCGTVLYLRDGRSGCAGCGLAIVVRNKKIESITYEKRNVCPHGMKQRGESFKFFGAVSTCTCCGNSYGHFGEFPPVNLCGSCL